MKVYIVVFEPRATMTYDGLIEILGVFDERYKAVDCLLNYLKEDVFKGDFYAKLDEVKGVASGKYCSVDVWEGREDNSSEWYQLTIFEREVN